MTPIQRIAVAKRYEEKIRSKAKEKLVKAGKQFGENHPKENKSFSPVGETLSKYHTRKELAKIAKVGTGTISRYETVMKLPLLQYFRS